MKNILTVFLVTVLGIPVIGGCMTAQQMASMGVPANYARSPVLDTKPAWRTVVLPPAAHPSPSSAPQGATLRNYAEMALLRTGRFTLIDRSLVDELLKEQEFSYSGAVDQNTAVALGRMLGAEAVMTISIGSITHDSFWDDEPDQRDASLHVRIVSVETSEVLYSSAGAGSSFNGAEEALQSALEVSLIGLFK